MIDVVKRFFGKATTEASRGANQNTGHDIRVATCALFVEIARIDEKFTAAEMATILSILKQKYSLSQDHADALIAEAERELEKSVDLWQFTRLIVYVDGKMDQYEHYLMNKLQNLLRLTHDQLITAKLKVLHSEK
jgi:uncharacterized tellurite resistance protein B-like protein